MTIPNYQFVCPFWIIPMHRKNYMKDKEIQRCLTSRRKDMKIGIIGAGAAGLAALKHSLDEHHNCEVFEQTGLIGGTWNYTDKTGSDEYGLPIHTSMYQGLRTNLPKELMQFEGFPFSKPDHSYVTQPEVLQYIHDYAAHFNLLPHIKFFKHVLKVSPLEKGRWSVDVKDLESKTVDTKEFDAIVVCIGNFSVPSIPTFPGLENFQGTTIHSHDFRKSDVYKNRKVLVIGSGSSGIDISRLVKEVADTVIICHRSPINPIVPLPDGIQRKTGIQEFRQHSVLFSDGSEATIDDVILCTGYKYSYPFLCKECSMEVEGRWVKYLYKQIMNINHPTMAFIGIPFRTFPFVLFGIQIRFFLAYLNGNFSVTKKEMLEDLQKHMETRNNSDHSHLLGIEQRDYLDDLATTANIKKIPPVYSKMYRYVHDIGKGKIHWSYKIINDEEFIVVDDNQKTSS
ncbi:dimethylaniline monooxygenase [N-oxide-forming] 4-like isoform X1 [Diorhabda carinulata]|uniref:dimethylaniline monooxygenase [N-oxide-forming] 4-like isoform X1 n=2 Tax=Diorhabda carinulata TaxID=1163345 RepID=UPI0025A0DD06|nr:dimethylaniline monooxygenase [N-oxide-forming] 4-like isoform X1 [Diorhabda carinulata]